MANMHSKTTKPLYARLPVNLVDQVKTTAADRGEDLKVLVQRALETELARLQPQLPPAGGVEPAPG